MTFGGAPNPQNPAQIADMRQAAAERYAQIRLHQAVAAGLIPPHLIQGAPPPGGWAAMWRLVSQSVSQPAQEAGWADPGAWLRSAGHPAAPGPIAGTPGDPNAVPPPGQANMGLPPQSRPGDPNSLPPPGYAHPPAPGMPPDFSGAGHGLGGAAFKPPAPYFRFQPGTHFA